MQLISVKLAAVLRLGLVPIDPYKHPNLKLSTLHHQGRGAVRVVAWAPSSATSSDRLGDMVCLPEDLLTMLPRCWGRKKLFTGFQSSEPRAQFHCSCDRAKRL